MEGYSTVADVKPAESIFEDALQASYFKSNNGVKTAMLNVIEQAPGEVVRYSCDPELRRSDAQFSPEKSVAEIITQIVLPIPGFFIQMDSVVEKCRRHDIE